MKKKPLCRDIQKWKVNHMNLLRSLRRAIGLLAIVGSGLAGVSVATATAAQAANIMPPCHADTNLPDPRTGSYVHGAPQTGLLSRHGYYYLDVKFGPGCGLGTDGLLHVVAHVHAIEILPSGRPGNFKGAYVPDNTHHAVYWLEFHSASGKQYSLPGGNPATSSRYVSTADHKDMNCLPGVPSDRETCQDGPGASNLTLRYDGPDIGLSHGSFFRFRIANESGVVITDFAQMDVVRCSTCVAPIGRVNYGPGYPGTPGG